MHHHHHRPASSRFYLQVVLFVPMAGSGSSEGKQCLCLSGKTMLGPFPLAECGLGQAEKPRQGALGRDCSTNTELFNP